MVLPTMAMWAKMKGIDVLTTGDWTHPLWFREIGGLLEEAGEGVFKLKDQDSPLFLLTVEVSSIYNQGGRLRRIHNLIFAPSFATVEKINKELARRGVNLMSDGRPIMGLSSRDLVALVLGVDEKAMIIPCHAWTPWFSLYGANSGFDSIDECFGEYSKYIYGIETGLSSDPAMNWKIKELGNRSILSFSDAHSPAKMGREATVFDLPELTYENIRKAIMRPYEIATSPTAPRNDNMVKYTIEFYPEEGKYHYTGHRNCKVVQTPEETAKNGTLCPVCKRTLTVGVEHRVQDLATESGVSEQTADEHGASWMKDSSDKRPPYVSLVPLLEIIAEALSSTTASEKVKDLYMQLTKSLGTELTILLKTPIPEIGKRVGERVADGVKKVRERNIIVVPGYDGVYGVVKIWDGEQKTAAAGETKKEADIQLGLF